MAKREAAKHKIDRRLGVNLWGRAKSPLNRRNTKPGQHGSANKKLSDFGQQLRAKQKMKMYYGDMGERMFRRYYEEAVRRKGDTSENLISLLERRLDTVVYRAKLAATIFGARQLVNHGHVLVNGKRVNIRSYAIKDNDVVTLKDKAQRLEAVLLAQNSKERDVPEYLQFDARELKAVYLRAPKFADVPYPVTMEPNLVIEYYSR